MKASVMLNSEGASDASDDNVSDDDADDDNASCKNASDDNAHDAGEEGSLEQINEEGSLWSERAQTLKEYGFICRCSRCRHEQNHKTTPYCKQRG